MCVSYLSPASQQALAGLYYPRMMAEKKEEQHSFDARLAVAVGIEKAILVGGIHFWISENEKRKSALHFRDGEYWTYDTAKELAVKYPYLKEKSIYRWLDQLEQGGWIKRRQFNLKGVLDKTTWYGRGARLLAYLKRPISQNENSLASSPISQNEKSTRLVNPAKSQNEKSASSPVNSISQNEKSTPGPVRTNSHSEKSTPKRPPAISQNETSMSQNESTNSQNEKSLYNKETVTNTIQTTFSKQQQSAAEAAVAGAEEVTSGVEKKRGEAQVRTVATAGATLEAPPISIDAVRALLLASAPHQRYAIEQLKLVDSQAGYKALVELFITQQQATARDPEQPFTQAGPVRRHFMNWLGRRAEFAKTPKPSPHALPRQYPVSQSGSAAGASRPRYEFDLERELARRATGDPGGQSVDEADFQVVE